MTTSHTLWEAYQRIARERGVGGEPTAFSVELFDAADGNGPQLVGWAHGDLPTQDEIDAAVAAVESAAYQADRKRDILAEWSIEAQLEALTEAQEDPPRPGKLNQLLAHIAATKTKHEKPGA